jgi:EmrB/QacA subfamily drug resistance transporter
MSESSRHKWAVLALTCLVQFMVVLDIAIVNVALPSIQGDLGMAQDTLQWLVITYGLFLGGFLLLGGRLADIIGRRRVLQTGLALFSAASLVAGLSDSASLLIAARGIQGLGAALMAPAALSILAVTFADGAERNKALGIFGAVGGSSASVGVIASGVLVDGPGWRWIFFINVPVGVALLALSSLVVAKDSRVVSRRVDVRAAMAVTASLVTLIYALNRGADHGWGTPSTLGLFAAAAALFVVFLRIENRSSQPLVPTRVVRERSLVVANAMAFFVFGSFFAYIFIGSLLMQQVLGFSPTRTGISWLATSVTAFVVAGATGAGLLARFGARRLLVTAMVSLTVGGLWLARVPASAHYATDLLPAFILAGIAIGLASVSVQISALTGVSSASAGLVSGLVETMREIGGAVGVAAVSTVLVSGSQATVGHPQVAGFHGGFLVITIFAGLGAALAALGFRSAPVPAHAADDLEPAAAYVTT